MLRLVILAMCCSDDVPIPVRSVDFVDNHNTGSKQ
jgi:hypothetical protein